MADVSNQQAQRIGPYRVEERLGVGGMGEVFKAYDDRLQRWVAIKRIRGDKDEAEENRERFQREARATAKLNHNSIVHLYDIFRDGDSDCIVMEYVEGVTLDSLVRQGPLEPMQVASLGQEIASGLAEAHAKGIIHRDLKVENIMLTPEGHAKILDFGLARPLLKGDLDDTLTGKGQLVGTSRSMSPEYVGGEEIDHRSDLFSLGVLLYEAATSHSPFRAHNTLATLRQVMLHQQTPAYLVNPNVPEELSVIIDNLLEKQPDDRPQNAREVSRAFSLISGNLSSGDVVRPQLSSTFTTSPTEIFTPTPTSIDLWGRKRWLGAIAALLIVGIGATYVGTRWWITGAEDVPKPGMVGEYAFKSEDRIVIANFQNHTGEPLLDDSLELAFRLGLEQSRYASVLPRSQVKEALLRMKRDASTPVDRAVGIEICQRENARALVIGSIGKIGDTYSLSAEIVDPRDGVNIFTERVVAKSRNAILPALEKITKAVRLHLGESLAASERDHRPLEKATTENLEALKAYSLAVARLFENDHEAAIPLLERALTFDPDFAMAHAKLAAAYMFLGRDRDETLKHLNQASLSSDRLTESEKLYVDGWTARLHGEPSAVVRAWSLMSEFYPSEYVGHFNLGNAYWSYYAQFEEAAAAFEASTHVATRENLSTSLSQLGYCQIAMGRLDAARRSFEKCSPAERRMGLFDLYLVTENYTGAEEMLQVEEPSRQSQMLDALHAAYLLLDRGRFDDALRRALEAEELATDEAPLKTRLAIQLTILLVQEHLGDAPAYQRAFGNVNRIADLALDGSYEQIDKFPVQMLSLVGKLNARSSSVETAEAIRSKLAPIVKKTPIPVWRSQVAMLNGEILAAQGRHQEALDVFRESTDEALSFQAHESLARALVRAGSVAEAIEGFEWLLDRRGLAYVECLELCVAQSLFDWAMAHYRLGRLYERNGDPETAAGYYRRFLEHWPDASTSEAWRTATARISALQP